jgi:predicted RecB family nuclease
MLAPPPLEDARSSLEYWQRRRKVLPFHRRTARREAKEMATRWQERVRAAELARFEASLAGRLLARLGISSIWFQRAQTTSQLLSWVVWAVLLRKVKLVLTSFAAIGILIVVLLIVLIAQLT